MKTVFYGGSEPIKRLRRLQREFHTKDIILAGGALRDDFMGKPHYISDYDIFMSAKGIGDDFQGTLEDCFPDNISTYQLFDSSYLSLEDQQDIAGEVKPGPNKQIVEVWQVDCEDDVSDSSYQIILTKGDPVEHVNKYFDIGICKTYCDGTKIRYTDDFLYDVRHHQLTIVGDKMTKEQVEYAVYHHCDKIQNKYGKHYRIVVPPRYQKFFTGGFPSR